MLPLLLSLPERGLRILALVLGGLAQEGSVLLPADLRRSRLYQTSLGRFLRILVEGLGGARGVFPADGVAAGELALRKTAGNALELAGLASVGFSPLWLLAVAADLTGGSKAYGRALLHELQRDGLLRADTDFSSVGRLLDDLEATSGLAAETLDLPPLNLAELRRTLTTLRDNAASIPEPGRLAEIFDAMVRAADLQDRSLRSISLTVAEGAWRAGADLRDAHIYDYFRQAFDQLEAEGAGAYARRRGHPYRTALAGHLDPRRPSCTERRLRGRRSAGAMAAPARDELPDDPWGGRFEAVPQAPSEGLADGRADALADGTSRTPKS
ncbi:MAG: hypothetical protein KDH92_07415 [Chloroflexi bacterium]|nr:hypothetical protein [Chloroflexota bacterium]